MRSGSEHTPLLDAWRERFRHAVSESGAKTALAEHMAALRGQGVMSWKVNISRILAGTLIPGGENLLALTEWLDAQERNPKPPRRKP